MISFLFRLQRNSAAPHARVISPRRPQEKFAVRPLSIIRPLRVRASRVRNGSQPPRTKVEHYQPTTNSHVIIHRAVRAGAYLQAQRKRGQCLCGPLGSREGLGELPKRHHRWPERGHCEAPRTEPQARRFRQGPVVAGA